MGKTLPLAILIALFTLYCFAFASPASAAEPQIYGNWQVGAQTGGAGLYASTINDDGLVLGEYCYFKTKTCSWLVGADSSCDKDDTYPTLGNTDKGAASLELYCGGKLEALSRYVYQFKNWKALEALMQKSALLGLAVPMQGDRFKVWRFSLDGMVKSQAVMEAAFFGVVAPKNAPPKQNTSSSTL